MTSRAAATVRSVPIAARRTLRQVRSGMCIPNFCTTMHVRLVDSVRSHMHPAVHSCRNHAEIMPPVHGLSRAQHRRAVLPHHGESVSALAVARFRSVRVSCFHVACNLLFSKELRSGVCASPARCDTSMSILLVRLPREAQCSLCTLSQHMHSVHMQTAADDVGRAELGLGLSAQQVNVEVAIGAHVQQTCSTSEADALDTDLSLKQILVA